MTQQTSPALGADVQAELASAAASLQSFAQGPAKKAANDVGASFEQAGVRIARSLGGAARGGENAFRQLAKTALEELAKIALNQIFGAGAKTPPLFGAKANGGAVNAGGAYLVGERGPELFVPRQAGAIAPAAGAVSVHFHLAAGADVSTIMRSQAQIGAAIARAVAAGRRNL